LGLQTKGGSSTDTLKRRIKELNCDISHFGVKPIPNQAKYSLDEILIENSTYANISSLKRRLIKEGVLEYKCSCCGINDWLGKPITLQLDHINGKNNDHRLENLRFLCPNCHSQTETYAGKNKVSTE
jgi:5-methylcytosine-specific restriction endonuclease McrA